MTQLSIAYLALDVDVGKSTGEATHVLEMVTALGRLGHRVSLILPGTESNAALDRELDRGGVTTHLLDRPPGAKQVLEVRSLVAGAEPDILYERRFVPKVGVTISRLLDVPLIVEINSISPVDVAIYYGRERDSPVPSRVRKLWHTTWLQRVDAIVTVTHGLAEVLRREYGLVSKRIEVLPNGANITLFRPMDPVACRIQLGLPQEVPVICFVGDLAPWYEIDNVLEAISQLAGRGVSVRFLVLGDGILREFLQAKAREFGIEDSVLWKGRVPHENVPTYIGASDIALAPFRAVDRKTRAGVSALKIFEYMACARPVITTQVVIDTQPDFVGIVSVVTPNDINGLASEIETLLGNRAQREFMGAAGRRLVEENYSWTRIAKSLVEFMGSVLLARRLFGE